MGRENKIPDGARLWLIRHQRFDRRGRLDCSIVYHLWCRVRPVEADAVRVLGIDFEPSRDEYLDIMKWI